MAALTSLLSLHGLQSIFNGDWAQRRRLVARPRPSATASLLPPLCAIAAPSQPRSSRSDTASKPSTPQRRKSGTNKGRNIVEKTRLNKALASVGVASRRASDDIIFAGRVAVNGAVVTEPGTQVDLSRDKLSLDGKMLSTLTATKKFYFALNKPKGYICTSKAEGTGGSGDRLVVDLFSEWLKGWKSRHPGNGSTPPRLFTVGRLDVASVGLIFVTNDGDWAQAVQHPSSGITKEYSVTLNRRPTRSELEKLNMGCEIDGVQVAPIAAAIDDSDMSKNQRIRVILSEGKNREVRRLVDAAGLEVRQLRRVRIGGFRLPRSLTFGQFRELRPHEVRRVLNVGADRTI